MLCCVGEYTLCWLAAQQVQSYMHECATCRGLPCTVACEEHLPPLPPCLRAPCSFVWRCMPARPLPCVGGVTVQCTCVVVCCVVLYVVLCLYVL